jgi:hypothetical protein
MTGLAGLARLKAPPDSEGTPTSCPGYEKWGFIGSLIQTPPTMLRLST